MENYVIQTQGLSKKYGDKLAVNNVDMHVPQGSVYGFVGENGSGKTTIMRLLMGLAIPTGGQYALFGVDSLMTILNMHVYIMELPIIKK